jgi:hypothetical protein
VIEVDWPENKSKKTLEFPTFSPIFAILKKLPKWGIKHKNLPFSRSRWENSIVLRGFLTPSSLF